MTITRDSAKDAGASASTASSVTVATPSGGYDSGKLLIAGVISGTDPNNLSIDNGFTVRRRVNQFGVAGLALASKDNSSGAEANIKWSSSVPTDLFAIIVQYSGLITATSLDANPAGTSSGGALVTTLPGPSTGVLAQVVELVFTLLGVVGDLAAPLVTGGGAVIFNQANRLVAIEQINAAALGYQRIPGGTSGKVISSPDSAAISVTGDLDIRVRLAMDAWHPTPLARVFAKTAGSPQASWELDIQTSGIPRLLISTTGSDQLIYVASVAPTVTNGTTLWLRATRVVSTGVVTFYTSTDATNDPTAPNWTQLGSPTAAQGTGSGQFDNTSKLTVGDRNVLGGTSITGNVYRATLMNGIGGTVVWDADFTIVPVGANGFVESSSNAATVTFNGPGFAATGGNSPTSITHTPSWTNSNFADVLTVSFKGTTAGVEIESGFWTP